MLPKVDRKLRDMALNVLAGLVLDTGEKWGEVATPDQWEDAEAILDLEGPPYHFITRARGYSKTTDLAGIVLAVLLTQLGRGAKAYGVAADRDQAALLLDAMASFIDRSPGLQSQFKVDAFRATCLTTGATFEALAADASSIWGLRPSFVVIDEVTQWSDTPGPRRVWEGISSAVAKVPGCRLVVICTAGDPAHFSRKILDHAYAEARI